MARKYKNPIKRYFRDFGHRVIRLKYFIMVVGALVLEIITLVIYILNNENFIEFELFTASILYGAISVIIVVLAVGCLVLMRVDKTRDRKKINLFNDFKRSYYKLIGKYSRDIGNLVRNFDKERNSIDEKINYAIVLADKYSNFYKDFSNIKVPGFLNDAAGYESEHLFMEKMFFTNFSLFSKPNELEKINKESDLAHEKFIREIDSLEKRLKIII